MRVHNAVIQWSTDGSASYGTSGDISNSALYSQPFSMRHMEHFSAQLVLSGATVTGTFKLQASNDNPNVPPTSGFPDGSTMNWTDIDGSSTTLTVAGNHMWSVSSLGYLWIRIVWTESGTAAGTVTGRYNAKGSD